MRGLIIAITMAMSFTACCQVKYSVIINGEYIQVGPDGTLDTINVTNNIQALEYEAILTLENSSVSVRVLRNDFGADVAWAHAATGTWTGTLADAFASNKTAVFAQQQGRGSAPRYYTGEFTDAGNITLYAMNSSLALADPSVSQQVYVSIKRYQ